MATPFRDVRDTFIRFLADNLVDGSSIAIPINVIRNDPNDAGAANIKTNAVNIKFLNLAADSVASQQVVIDVINDSENTAVDWMEAIWSLLRSAFYTTLFTYANPLVPVAQKSNIMWDQKAVKFHPVVSANYSHYSCVLPLKFLAII